MRWGQQMFSKMGTDGLCVPYFLVRVAGVTSWGKYMNFPIVFTIFIHAFVVLFSTLAIDRGIIGGI